MVTWNIPRKYVKHTLDSLGNVSETEFVDTEYLRQQHKLKAMEATQSRDHKPQIE